MENDMGMDLTNNRGEYFSINRAGWSKCLNTAFDFGWKPEGTEHEDYQDWDGNYTSNDGQVITAKDANALSGSLLEAALKRDAPKYLLDLAEFAKNTNIIIL
jgi:hypothetical protein